VVIEEDGFLPDDVMSVFGYFLGDFKANKQLPGKPRYFNQITVPDYWEISGSNSGGSVHDLNRERAKIFYTEPRHKRLVKIVDWYDEKGVVRSSDHYNRYGALYARTIFNNKGQKVNKTYFSTAGEEVIMENYVTGDLILNDGERVEFFHNKTDFVIYFLKKTGYDKRRIFYNSLSTPFFASQRLSGEKKDILFWQEPKRDDIPGNMLSIFEGKNTRTCEIKVQKKQAYVKLLELGAPAHLVKCMGFVYDFKRENQNRPEALICTNSDRVEQCRKLALALPEMTFHITALTEMSSKLLAMGAYKNVKVYPGVKQNVLDELFEKCDYYFDINHEAEIVSAVQRAFLNNQLIVAFKETLHNPNYVAEEHIFESKNVEDMITLVKKSLVNPDEMEACIDRQHQLAMAEDAEAYRAI
jgi:accessory Sec system glycosyltransferase GtfB